LNLFKDTLLKDLLVLVSSAVNQDLILRVLKEDDSGQT